jgi:hypothetical protein
MMLFLFRHDVRDGRGDGDRFQCAIFAVCVRERERERRLLNVIWSPQIFTFGWLYIAVLCMWSSITAPARMGGCAKFRE